MKQKIGTVSMWLLLGLTMAFQFIYGIGLRESISNGSALLPNGEYSRETFRDVADHFVYCVGLVHYFLFGYLYSVKGHYVEKRLNEKNGKTMHWVILEIFCQLGIFLSYLFVWLDNWWYYIDERIGHWTVGRSSSVWYVYLCREGSISTEYTWVKQYGAVFYLTFIAAPVLLMLLLYGIHGIYRLIQFKHNNCLNKIWAVWTVIFFLAIVLLAVWGFRQMGFEGWWYWNYERRWNYENSLYY